MDKDQIKGKAKDIAGRIERQAGEWTGDKKSQAEGLEKQVEGKVQKAWGDVKDEANRGKSDADDTARRETDRESEARKQQKDEPREDEVA